MEKKIWVATLFLLLIISLVLQQEKKPSWAHYQQEYINNQKKQLQSLLTRSHDEKVRTEIQTELDSLKERKPEIVNIVLPNGQVERCKTCHIGIEEISSSHPSNTFGCTVCHGGNPLSVDKATAHAHMLGAGHPGSLDVASLSCGSVGPNGEACHSKNSVQHNNEVDLVKASIMSTKAGELSTIRMTYGLDQTNAVPNLSLGEVAIHYPDPLTGLPKEKGFQENCLSMCHQGGEGILPSDSGQADQSMVNQYTAQGCEVCHVLTNPQHMYQGNDTAMRGYEAGHGMTHQLSTQIPYTQCNQCHNQGIHDPVQMKFSFRSDLTKVVEDWQTGNMTWDNRVADYYLPGELFAKCEISLDCIDCHTRQDVMGDGKLWTSQYDAVHIQCVDCHGTLNQQPLTKVVLDLNDPAFEEKITNPVFPELKMGDSIVMTQKGEAMPFIRQQGQEWILYSRINGESFRIPQVMSSQCKENPEEQNADSCHKCHTGENIHK
ncbi:cytochrome c3 family protein [Desulfitobacterium sp.]|uniref:cytochrome c3 family protein n=1 Tax=Desulfitobacterium sp. TaxID=49981 RepID=UPI002B1ED735|nr:cytochrome c3 family protein [Desulfitobacterium sp.]MEA4900900.1 cytochrome c3 family protein [Desulfitobacterium sp.]